MLVIIGPSASGKTQIVNKLIEKYNMKKMVTYTTRPMRSLEQNGIDYHFISVEDFKQKIEDGFFLEYVCYNNNYYGTSKSSIADDKVVILESEGLKTYIKEAKEQIKIVFVRCSKEIRRLRMTSRGDSIESIKKRLLNDDNVFSEEIKNLADFVIDTSNSNTEKDTKTVYDFYKKYI